MSESKGIGAGVRATVSAPSAGAEREPAMPSSGVASVEFAPGCMVAGKYLVERAIGEGGLGA
ncbi:MAG: hypothetical protein ACRELB_00080, partial [Polyangiaceae bacterium]